MDIPRRTYPPRMHISTFRYTPEELTALRLTPGVVHPRYGDLNLPGAVTLTECRTYPGYITDSPFIIHLSITGKCNARCAGCINAAITRTNSEGCASAGGFRISDTQPERDAAAILHLVQDENNVMVCFYGGEPLLELGKMRRAASLIRQKCGSRHIRFMIYTNGELLSDALQKCPSFMSEAALYSVSIDGTHRQHERIRKGTTLDRIHKGLEMLKAVRSGAVLMWSTLREEQSLRDCFREFLFLRERGLADHFFWHWVEQAEPYAEFAEYLKSYEDDLHEIMSAYVTSLHAGQLLSIIHINELVLFLLTGERRSCSACGVERARNYDIMDGKVFPCADLPQEFILGPINETGIPDIAPLDLNGLTAYKSDLGCFSCGVHGYCGGRCPVQALISTPERLVQYCQLMRLHVGVVCEYIDDIKRAVSRRGITSQQLYDTSARYVQFTDGTP